ncbi:MAG: hypothetical protein L6406_08145 [Desulfobacterales bacterium]|nr:hypothetical protein [Candidatus Omnitrophota bacterium]MCG2775634.1 hypothetical protein [Desulfobacterales bacterium]
MGIHIFRTMNEYVKHINDIEQDGIATLVASSFLSSHLFSKSIIMRFFERDLGSKQAAREAANDLWKRSKRTHTNIRKVQHKEIYEIDAIEEFCKSGIVHRQVPNFRATPKEIIEVLQTMVSLLQNLPLYGVAFCREVLPFVFIVKTGKTLTIDVRNNFGYQRIQGLLIEDAHIVAEFEKEFWRIWNESSTLSDRSQVIAFIEDKIALVADSTRFLVGR